MSTQAQRNEEERRIKEAWEEMSRLNRMICNKQANLHRRLYQVRVVQKSLEVLAATYKVRDSNLQDPAY